MRKRTAVVALFLALALAGGYFEPAPVHAQIPQTRDSALWTCSLDDIGATLTLCIRARTDSPFLNGTMYLTTVVAQSTTATAGNFILRTGTGTNCGTGTASLLPSAATAVRLAAPANTVPPTVIALTTPLKIPVGNDLCVLGVVTNTFSGQLSGYYAAN